jgi:hypothetical protein
MYIGASKDIHQRWVLHKSELRRGVHSCQELQADWNTDGIRAFFFTILTLCRPEDLRREEAAAQAAHAGTYNTYRTWKGSPPLLR